MSKDLAELLSVLENEVLVGEELSRNLEAQKNAIVEWDIAKLLEQIDAREPWLRSLRLFLHRPMRWTDPRDGRHDGQPGLSQ